MAIFYDGLLKSFDILYGYLIDLTDDISRLCADAGQVGLTVDFDNQHTLFGEGLINVTIFRSKTGDVYP